MRSIIQNIYANVWGFLGHNGEDPIIMAALLIIFSHSCWQVVWCLCHGSYLSISQHSRVKLSVLRLWNDYDSNRSWWKKLCFELPSRRDSTFGLNCICMCIYGFGFGFRKILNNQKILIWMWPPWIYFWWFKKVNKWYWYCQLLQQFFLQYWPIIGKFNKLSKK